MPYCRQCGSEMLEGDAFCRKCGAAASTGVQDDSLPTGTMEPSRDPFQSFFNRSGAKAAVVNSQRRTVATRTPPQSGNDTEHMPYESPAKPREIYAGTIHKCPRCGEPMDWDDAKCPACGWELRDARTVSSSDIFSQKLMNLQREIDEADAKKLPFLRYKEEEKVRMKVDLIRTFAIPNTEEDLVEFAVLAASNSEDSRIEIANAWKAKLQQTADKADFLFPGTPECEKVHVLADRLKEKEEKERKDYILLILICFAVFLFCLFMIMFM